MSKFLFSISNVLRSSILTVMVLMALSGSLWATEYYVAKTGNDNTNTGLSISSPFLTIQKAADVAVSGDIINVRAGVYREMVDLKADGVTYRPYSGESVTINGTDLLTTWTLSSGSTYSATMNWDVDPVWGANQLFSDGKMIELARWPNQTSSDIIMPTNAIADGVTASGNTFTITDSDFNEPSGRWVGAKIWVNLAHNGKDGHGSSATVIATSGNTITVSFEDPRLGDQPWGLGENTEYYLFDPTQAGIDATGGIDAVLDPGEWWKNGNTVYVKTPNGAAPSSTGTGTNVIEAKRRHFAFWASTTRANYTIKDFNLFGCSVTTYNDARNERGIVEAAHDIILEGLNVLYPSHQIVTENITQDYNYTWTGLVVMGRNNIIRNCKIRYAATSAISIQGVNIKVLNNEIQDANYMCSNSGALNTGFVCKDSEIANNKMWNTTMMAINFSYSQNSNPNIKDVYRIHHNEIFNFMRRSGDSGAIDMAGRDLQWIRIDHNLIYNTLSDASLGELKHGVYLDFGGAGKKIRATVDHNIMYNITTPVLVNDGTDIDIYNNVLLTNEDGANGQFAIGNYNGGTGAGIRIYNNIMSHPGNLTGCCGDLSASDFRNNITNARGSVLTALFVDAANGNFNLKSTATDAIDKGISVGVYDDNVQGIPDLGAKEWGTFLGSPDTTPPAVPPGGFSLSNVTSTSFLLSWTASTDNIAVVSYDVYANGVLIANTPTNSVNLKNLTSSTTYFIKLKAVDATGNRSGFSTVYEAKTLLNDAFISAAVSAPVIDGTQEAAWSGINYPLGVSLIGSPTSADLSGSWTSLWDANNLYLFVDVTDDNKVVNSGSAWYDDDRIEIFIDADNDKGPDYGVRDYQYFIRPGESTIGEIHFNATNNVELSNVNTSTGYKLEIKIPFATLGITPAAFKSIGIDIQVADDDGAGTDAKKAWYSTVDATYRDPSLMGTAQLKNAGAADVTPPSIPTSLKASGITPNRFALSWTASTDDLGVGFYEIFKDGNLIETVTTNSYNVTNLSPTTTYAMAVKAKDQSGNLSALSSVLNVTTLAIGSETKYEAENATLSGSAEIAANHSGYSGSGFVAGYGGEGAATTFTVNVATGGSYDVLLSYANNFGPSQTLSIYVNDVKIKQIALPATGSWSGWQQVSEALNLNAGNNTIKYQYDNGDSGNVNIDYISLYTLSGDSEAPTVPTNLQLSGRTTTTLIVNWTASTDNTGVTEYEIYKDGTLAGNTVNTNYTITGLTASTTYTITVKAKDASGSISDASAGLSVATLGANLATTGTGYRWSMNLASALENTNRVAEPGINDGDFDTDVPLNNGDDLGNAYEAAGIIWGAAPASIGKVIFRQGAVSSSGNASFTANLSLQFTTDGTTWTESGWAVSPTYPYTNVAAEKYYSFTGTPVSGILGVRVSGQVFTDNVNSWYAIVKEVAAYDFVDSQAPTPPTSLQSAAITANSFSLSWTASVDDEGVAEYEVFKDNVSIGTTPNTNFNVTGLDPVTVYSITVKAKDAAGNSSAASTALSVTTGSDTGNLALNGTAYRWSQNLSSALENTNRQPAPGINDGDINTDVSLNNGVDDLGNAYEAAGIIWNSSLNNIARVQFKQGSVNSSGNASFTANLSLQFTTDGTTWTESGWSVNPAYPYDNTAAGKFYIFTGTPVAGLLGVRISGQVQTNSNSWEAIIKEVEAYSYTDNQAPGTPINLTASLKTTSSFRLNWTASTDNRVVRGYEVYKDGILIGFTSSNSFNVNSLNASTAYSMTVRAIDNAENTSAISTALVVNTLGLTDNFGPAGTGYRWSKNLFSALLNTNRVAEPGINDEDFNTDVPLNNGDDLGNAYEAAGIIWESAPASIGKVTFRQGTETSVGNASFTANLSLQFTTDGTTWTESGWTVSPTYPYTNVAAEQYYSFTGTPVSGILGVRVSGQVFTDNINSWYAIVKEVAVYATDGTLPVTLTNFVAEKENDRVKLTWTTASEIDNDYFEIERSSDGVTFKKISKLKAKSATGGTYTAYDDKPLAGTNYYKLIQYDKSGHHEVLGIKDVTITFNGLEKITFYPNPVEDGWVNLIFNESAMDESLVFTLTDLNGKVIHKESFKSSGKLQRVNIGKPNAGVYIINLIGASTKYVSKLIVK